MDPANTDPVSRVIQANPCLLDNIETINFNIHIPYDEEWEQMKSIIFMMVAAPLAGSVLSASGALETITTYFAELIPTITSTEARRRAVCAAKALSVDIAVQTAIIYYFPREGESYSFGEALSQVNLIQAAASAIEGATACENPLLEFVAAPAFSCILDGYVTENGTIREDFDWEACGEGVISAVLFGAIIELSPSALGWMRQIPSSQVVDKLKGMVDWPELQNASLLRFFKKTKAPGSFSQQQILDLFGLPAGTNVATITNNLNNNPNTPNLLDVLEQGHWWDDIATQFPDVATRKNFLEDITRDVNFAVDLKARPELVGAWEGLFNTGLRTDIPWLTRASKWLDEGAEFAADGSGKLTKNGQQILEIRNNKILPDKYDYPVSGGTPVGEASNGYQVVKNGNDLSVRRVPETAGYSQSDLAFLTQHPSAHVLERHGHDVTDAALIKRSTTGIAPDGHSTGIPPHSSKFRDQQAVMDAIDNVKPGTPAFAAREQQPNGLWVVEHPGNFGYGYANGGAGPVQMFKVTAVYSQNANGFFELITMYPNR
ncbi:MAG: hypothetical protein R2795_14990 [Saprospiraceae bacterium]